MSQRLKNNIQKRAPSFCLFKLVKDQAKEIAKNEKESNATDLLSNAFFPKKLIAPLANNLFN